MDLSGLEGRFNRLEGNLESELTRVMQRLAREAEEHARSLLQVLVYDTPETTYERTGALLRSVYSLPERLSGNRWRVVVGAVGGAGGRAYAEFVERGTLDGRIDLSEILETARRRGGQLIRLEFGDPDRGVRARPFILPSAVLLEQRLPVAVIEAVLEADPGGGTT